MRVTQKTKTLFILGGGFAGIRTAYLLSKKKLDLDITLVDREPFHALSSTFYEVATAFIPWEKEAISTVLKGSASVPYEKIVDGTSIKFLQGIVTNINSTERSFSLADGSSGQADFLVLALGSQIKNGSVPGTNRYAFSLHNLDQAMALRSHIVSLFLRYRTEFLAAQQKAFTFAVVGGGVNGVEFAAELAVLLKHLCFLHGVNHSVARIIIFEETDTILRDLSPFLRANGIARLTKLGVEICLKTKITSIGEDYIMANDELRIPTMTVVWTGGVRANDVLLRSDLAINTIGGAVTSEHLEIGEGSNIFAAGDCTYFVDKATSKVAPDVAWAALKQAEVVAENIKRRIFGETLMSYYVRQNPIFMTIGGKCGLVYFPPYQFSGFFAWILKQLSELKYLWSILPNGYAFLRWIKSIRVKIGND